MSGDRIDELQRLIRLSEDANEVDKCRAEWLLLVCEETGFSDEATLRAQFWASKHDESDRADELQRLIRVTNSLTVAEKYMEEWTRLAEKQSEWREKVRQVEQRLANSGRSIYQCPICDSYAMTLHREASSFTGCAPLIGPEEDYDHMCFEEWTCHACSYMND